MNQPAILTIPAEPEMASESGAALRAKIVEQMEKMAKWIESEAVKL